MDTRRKLVEIIKKLMKKPICIAFLLAAAAASLGAAVLIQKRILLDLIAVLFLLLAAALFFTAMLFAAGYCRWKRTQSGDPEKSRERKRKRDALLHRKIRVAFYCDYPQAWVTFQELYQILSKDERFDVTVIAAFDPRTEKAKNSPMLVFLEKIGVPYRNISKYRSAKEMDFHYIFPCRPYDHVRLAAFCNENMKAQAKLCHITYGTCTFTGKILDIVCGFDHLHHYDFVFSETPDHTKIYQEKKKKYPNAKTRILEVGSPKFDMVRAGDFSFEETKYRQVVLYTPRWTMDDGTGSFLELQEPLLSYARENPDVLYIFRPHPLMESHFRSRVWKDGQWDRFLQELGSIENAKLDLDEDYLPSFKKASVLISDASSLIPEFLLTEKPLIYMNKKDTFNTFGKKVQEGCYSCVGWEEVEAVLRDLKNGIDPKQALRKEICNTAFYFSETQSSAEKMREILLEDYYG